MKKLTVVNKEIKCDEVKDSRTHVKMKLKTMIPDLAKRVRVLSKPNVLVLI
jgi:hypothetical protein